MTFHKTILASVSLVVFLTGSLSAQAMSSAAASEEAASASRSASPHGSAASEPDSEAHSSHPSVNPDEGAEVPLATLRHTRITPALFLEPGRTPLLKEKRFVPWNPNWELLSEKNHKHLAIDSLGRLVNEANPIHRFMARKSLEIYYSLVPNLRASRMSFREEAPACYSFDHLRAYLKGQFKAGNIWIARRFSESFQLAWNQKVDAAEAAVAFSESFQLAGNQNVDAAEAPVAARNLEVKEETRRLHDPELRRELLDVVVPEFQDPTLYPLWSAEERQRFLALKEEDWSPDITAREALGRILLERGRGCFAHCLRHPVLGPPLLEEVLRPWSFGDLENLTSLEDIHQSADSYIPKPVFPENVLPISEESQAEAARLFLQARTFFEIWAVLNSAHGPALMSHTSLERVYDNISGSALASVAQLLPNMSSFTWIFGSDQPLTSEAFEFDIQPFLQTAPETLKQLIVKYEGASEMTGAKKTQIALRARLSVKRSKPLAIKWVEASVPAQPSRDDNFFQQLMKQEMHRLFLDANKGTFIFPYWSWEQFRAGESETEATFGSFMLHNFMRIFEGMNLGESGRFYAALQALVGDRSEEELGEVDLSPLRDILNIHVWQAFQSRQLSSDPHYRVDFDDQGNPVSRTYYPNIPLSVRPHNIEFESAAFAYVPDFSYLSPRLQELLRKIQAEGRPIPAEIIYDNGYHALTSEPDSVERGLLEYADLFKVEGPAPA